MIKRTPLAAAALIALLSLGACGTTSSSTAGTDSENPVTESADITCEPVDLEAANVLGTGGEPGDWTANKAVAAKAPGRENAYLMAVDFTPSDGGEPVQGIFLTSGLTAADIAPIMAVDGYAHQFTHWPNSYYGETLSIAEPGAKQVKDCLTD